MNFILHEVKLWFKKENSYPQSYYLLPNKVNVVTGDATTGKSSFWSIIDYCLLSGKVNIANTIVEKVSWFGIRFTINQKEISITRRSPDGPVSSVVCYNPGQLPDSPKQNITIPELKSLLDIEFGIDDDLKFSSKQGSRKTAFDLSYRYFLLFNSLTEDIIGASKTYFDTTFYGKEEYDKALNHTYDLVIGVNDVENIKNQRRINEIAKKVSKIQKAKSANATADAKFESGVYSLIQKLKEHQFIEYSSDPKSAEEGLRLIENITMAAKKAADDEKLVAQISALNNRRFELRTQLSAIDRYRREYEVYKANLNRNADSLKPIEFLNQNLADQLIDTYETRAFVDLLEESLKSIQNSLSMKNEEPLKITVDERGLKSELNYVERTLKLLTPLKSNPNGDINRFMVLGEVKVACEQLKQGRNIKVVDMNELPAIIEEEENLKKLAKDFNRIKEDMTSLLNDRIQRNYDLLKSIPAYRGSKISFNDSEMILQLHPLGQLFPLDNVGSKSNYMFMHLCFYLGLHEHMINVGQIHVPQFLFIDQPSIPYYSGNDSQTTSIGNDDRSKLLDAFSLLDSFITYITTEKNATFQIFMVEHAPKEYWIENDLNNFHTVAEFINGEGLVPSQIYNA